MKYVPHEYQKRAIDAIISRRSVGLFLDMGLGKTVITLTAINKLVYDSFEITRALVIAPKRVAEDTWTREHEKWDHLADLKISRVLGSQKQRLEALDKDADVYVISRDNVQWLVSEMAGQKCWPFDMVVIDELSSFKNPQSKRFRALRKVMPKVKKITGLTGTPSPNGLIDLWAQIYLLDMGERLGATVTGYRNTYFNAGASRGHVVFKWNLKKGAAEEIEKKISDLCISMSASDYLDLPERIDNAISIKLNDTEMATYKAMERDMLVCLENNNAIVALDAGTVMNKLLQIANGRCYSEDGGIVNIHQRKIDALEELSELSDNLLVFYSYKHDVIAIKERFPDARILENADDISDWNTGRIKMLLAHPASVGYGLNLQEGGNEVVWYGLTWSLEQYQQANARLHRQGQKRAVIIHHLIVDGTVDENVMKALRAKDTTQAALLKALKERM